MSSLSSRLAKLEQGEGVQAKRNRWMRERQAIFEQLTDTELRLLHKPAPADEAKAYKLSQMVESKLKTIDERYNR